MNKIKLDDYFQIPIYSKDEDKIKRTSTVTIKVDNKNEAKKFARLIKKEMLKDIIKNPHKWLQNKNGGVQSGV